MSDGGPFRSAALAVVQTHREVVRCGWCAWSRIKHDDSDCYGTPYGTGTPHALNRDGDCVYYRDSFTTKLLRRFGLRQPALMRVVERDVKPDNSPRNGGSGHRGGNVGAGTGLRIGKRAV